MITIGMLLFPNLTQLDLSGPYEVFGRLPGVRILLLAKELKPIKSDTGLALMPTDRLDECADTLDLLFIPGGPGISQVMTDQGYISFIQRKAAHARFVTSVCTGSLVLAAAGLLDGYRATTHWLSLDLLRKFRVTVSEERVVIDRNRITGGGVTSGIDFALVITAQIFGEQVAKEIQLMLEYNPQPPFSAGHPSMADKDLINKIIQDRHDSQEARRQLIDQIIKK